MKCKLCEEGISAVKYCADSQQGIDDPRIKYETEISLDSRELTVYTRILKSTGYSNPEILTQIPIYYCPWCGRKLNEYED